MVWDYSFERECVELKRLALAEVFITDLHWQLMPSRPLTPAHVKALRLIATQMIWMFCKFRKAH